MTLPGHASGSKIVAVLAMVAVAACGRSQLPGLPATAPTASTAQVSSVTPPPRRIPSRLAVTWDGVALHVEANNASLNAVLHEVSRKTNMKITGSAPDERMFGSYGPGPLNVVVPALLNGVAVNLLLMERQGGAKDELVLTSRQGAATPAYIPTQQDAESAEGGPAQPAFTQPTAVGGARGFSGRRPTRLGLPPNGVFPPIGNDPVVPDNGINGRDNGQNGPDNGQNGADNGINGRDNGQNGTDNGLNNTATPGTVNADGTINQPGAGTGNQTGTQGGNATDNGAAASPNGVRTPQEIFEQLQRLRQQQAPQ